jgi:hypothetical protein
MDLEIANSMTVTGASVSGAQSGIVTMEADLTGNSTATILDFTSIVPGTSKLGQVLPGTRIVVKGRAKPLVLDPQLRRLWEEHRDEDDETDEFGTVFLDFLHGPSDHLTACTALHVATLRKGSIMEVHYFILLQRSYHKLYTDASCNECWIRIGSGFAERLHQASSKKAPPFDNFPEREFVIF